MKRSSQQACELEIPPGCIRDTVSGNSADNISIVTQTNSSVTSFLHDIPRHRKKGNTSYLTGTINFRTQFFRRQWFPAVTDAEWNDWRWQLRNQISTYEQVSRLFQLTQEEIAAFNNQRDTLPVAITPYYASLIDTTGNEFTLRKAVIPTIREMVFSPGESEDPLGESHQSPVPCIVHRYPNRVLFLVTNKCASYCRYCTRSRIITHKKSEHPPAFNRETWQKGIDYISAHPEINDVLMSGGDPLTLPDESLNWLLQRLRSIEHVQILRIGTKVPVVLPQRITPSLVKLLKQYHPLWINIHFTHPSELTPETRAACNALADAGIPLGSQTVLLAGINDDVVILKRLFEQLLTVRVRPYYLYQCDPIRGSAHFRTKVQKGVAIIDRLRGFTTGFAVPNFVIDAPGGGGKILVMPDSMLGYESGELTLRNFEGDTYRYPDYGL